MRQKIESYIEELFADDSSDHDYFHAIRVYNIAMKIAEHESCDKEIVMLGALLHDADDNYLWSSFWRNSTQNGMVKNKWRKNGGRKVSFIKYIREASMTAMGTESEISEESLPNWIT